MHQHGDGDRTITNACSRFHFYFDVVVARTIFIFNRLPMSSRSTRFCTCTVLSTLSNAVGSVWFVIKDESIVSSWPGSTGVLFTAYCRSAVTEIVMGCLKCCMPDLALGSSNLSTLGVARVEV